MIASPFSALALLTAFLCCGGFARASQLDEGSMRAACAAQSFLSANGYLDAPANSDRSQIKLEMWDRIKYEKDGVLNWDRLLADRRGSYSGRLWRIQRSDDDYLVAYKFPGNLSCLRVGDGSVHLHEANCILKKETVTRISEKDLNCAP
jgi:hypothetical protein